MEDKTNDSAIGVRVAQQLTAALTLNGIPYQKLADIVYGEFNQIAHDLKVGDFIEFPDGTTFTLTFKPSGV